MKILTQEFKALLIGAKSKPSLDYTYTKLADVKNPEYSLKGELWESQTFRVSAVNSEGNESEMSDPVGIVVTPLNEVSE